MTTNPHANRARMVNIRETRACTTPFECRANDDGQIVLNGYAATYEPYDLFGGPDKGGWREQIQPTAFDVTLASRPDLMLLINHEGMPLARTSSGTLQLSKDRHGLRVHALLDRNDPDVQRLLPKMKPQANGKSNMDEMSFGFRVPERGQLWDNSYTTRTITEINLHHGDVSIVNYGANHSTSAALGTLAELSSQDLVELRAKDPDLLDRAIANLAALRADDDGKSKKPYGDVKYADPGYQSDGQKRYPIDTEAHARAAWSYIHQGKNRGAYTAEQLSAIEGRIRGALKKFGVDVSEDKKSVDYIDTVRTANGSVTTLVAVLSDGSRVPLPTQYGSPAGAVIRSQPPDDDEPIEEPGVEAFRPDAPNTVNVGPVTAVTSDLDETLRMVRAAAGAAGSVESHRQALIAVSLPPTLAPSC